MLLMFEGDLKHESGVMEQSTDNNMIYSRTASLNVVKMMSVYCSLNACDSFIQAAKVEIALTE